MKEKDFKLLVLPSLLNMQQVLDMFSFPITLTEGFFKNIEIIFQDGQVKIMHDGIDLREFSFVWLSSFWGSRDLAYAIELYLDENNIPHTSVEKSTSKITDHMLFSLNDISAPDTLFVGHKNMEKCLGQIENVCGFPLVIKDIKGSRGTSSAKVGSKKELLKKMKILPKHKKYIFQKFIENKHDWGIMVSNGVVVAGEKRYHRKGEFRNNVCKGGTEVFVDPLDISDEIKQIALDSSAALGLRWSRTDIITDTDDQAHIMEVNRNPGLTSKTREIDGAFSFLSSQISPFFGKIELLIKKAEEARV